MPNARTVAAFDPAAMAASVKQLELRVAALEETIAGIRLQLLQAEARIAIETDDSARLEAPEIPARWTAADGVTFTGRTLIALGGAYLLRALTDGGVMPAGLGVLAGLTYAGTWIALSLRAATRGSSASAAFHGLAASLVGFPLIVEASTRFGLWPSSVGAAVLGMFTIALLLAARRAGVESVAWLGAIGGTLSALVLAISSAAFIPYTLLVAIIGVATLWLGYLDNWVLIRWPVAAAANLMVLLVTLRAVNPQVPPATRATVTLQLLVLVIYLTSFVGRALFLGREVIGFEIVQSAAVMTLCFGGAVWVLTNAGASVLPIGLVALVLGAGAYAFEFLYLERRQQRRNAAFFTTLAVAFTLAGVILVLPRQAATVVTGALALVFSEWARRARRISLAAHGVLFALSAAALTGLAGLAWTGLAASASHPWPVPGAAALGALVIVAACTFWPIATRPGEIDAPATRALRLGRLTLFVCISAGVTMVVAASLLTPPPGPGADAGVVASMRTVILLAFAGAVVCLPDRPGCREHGWIGYALLGAIAVKILAEDLPQGRPATLFLAFAAYGTALIAIPWLARRAARTA